MAGWFFRPFRSENNRKHTFHSSHQTHTKTVFFLSFQVRAITPVWAQGAVLTGLSPQCGPRELYWQGYHPSVGPGSCTDRAITPAWAPGAVLTGLSPQCGPRELYWQGYYPSVGSGLTWPSPQCGPMKLYWQSGQSPQCGPRELYWQSRISPQCGPRELYWHGYHPSVGPGSCIDRAITPVRWAQGAVLTGLSPQFGGPRELYWQGYYPSVVGPGRWLVWAFWLCWASFPVGV